MGTPQVLIGQLGHLASPRSAFDEALLDEEGLVHLLDGAAVLSDGRGNRVDAHRPALELVDDGKQYLVVYLVQSITVDIECLQGIAGDVQVNPAVASHLGKVAHAPQQGIGDTWRAAAASCNLMRRRLFDGQPQDACRTGDDVLEGVGVVVFQMQVDAEPGTQGCREQTATGGCPHQREGIEVNLDAARTGALVDHDVDAIVLHRAVEILLHHRRKAVDFVDEEHIMGFQAGEDARQVARLVEHGAAGNLEAHAQFVGDDTGEGGLSQSRRAMEQRMVERFALFVFL